MKTLALLKQLLPSEEASLRQHLMQHKRKKLYHLYECLLEYPEIEKPALFEQIFELPYHKKKDYKLRNELRLLNKEIESFWIEQYRSEVLRKDTFRQQRACFELLLERGALDLLKEDWQQALQKAQEASHFQQLAFLWELRFNVEEQTRESTLEVSEDAWGYLEKARQFKYWEGVERYLINRGREAYILANQEAYTRERSGSLPELPFEETVLQEHFLFEYLECITQSYLLVGTEKLRYLERSLELQEQVNNIRPRFASNAQRTWATIAIEYSIQRSFQKSHEAFQKVLPPWNRLQVAHLPIVYNYLVNLLYLGKLDVAEECFKAVDEILPTSYKFYARFCYMHCWLYLFQGESEKGLELLITDSLRQHADFDNYYARLLFALLYFQMDDWESCDRELTNMRQRMRYKKKEINNLFGLYANALTELLKWHMEPQSAEEQEAWGQRIIQELEAALKGEKEADLLFRKWICSYINTPKACT